jgi:hypothetical protein
MHPVPARTVELAASLADEWFSPGRADGLRQPAAPVSVYDKLLDGAGLGGPPPAQASWLHISELARQMGLK